MSVMCEECIRLTITLQPEHNNLSTKWSISGRGGHLLLLSLRTKLLCHVDCQKTQSQNSSDPDVQQQQQQQQHASATGINCFKSDLQGQDGTRLAFRRRKTMPPCLSVLMPVDMSLALFQSIPREL